MPSVNSSSVAEVRPGSELRSQPGACVHEFVARRAVENPSAVAVSSRHEELSYAELDRRATQLANYLRSVGVERNAVVGLYLLPAGSPVKNPLELLNMRQAKLLFEELP